MESDRRGLLRSTHLFNYFGVQRLAPVWKGRHFLRFKMNYLLKWNITKWNIVAPFETGLRFYASSLIGVLFTGIPASNSPRDFVKTVFCYHIFPVEILEINIYNVSHISYRTVNWADICRGLCQISKSSMANNSARARADRPYLVAPLARFREATSWQAERDFSAVSLLIPICSRG